MKYTKKSLKSISDQTPGALVEKVPEALLETVCLYHVI